MRNQEWIDIFLKFEWPEVPDTEYLVYSNNAIQPERIEYLQTALEISDVGDAAVYLLNPQIVTPEGEWEAWFLASWNGSIERYPSFWEMMQSEYRRFLKLNALDAKRFRVNGDPAFLFTKLPGLADDLTQQAHWYSQYLPMRSGLMELYDSGLINALQQTSQRLHLLLEHHTDASLLLHTLRSLADEAEEEQRYLQAKYLPEMTHINYWDIDIDKAALAATDFGMAEGLRQAAGMIRYFINES